MNARSIRWAFNFSKWSPTYSEMLLSCSCVQIEEQERLARFVFKKDVKSSLIGLLMMRKFVCEAYGKPYNDIKFIRDEKGKPQLADEHMKLSFNVSHHGDYVVCVGEVGEFMLGVDVMKFEYSGGKSLTEFFRIMNRQFSPQEWTTIRGAGNEKEQIAMFCRHWSLKESYVKAIGIGITINLQEISFKIKTQRLREDEIIDDTQLFIKEEQIEWKFHEVLLNSEHCVSVAIDNQSANKVPFKFLTFEELTQDCIPLLQNNETFVKQYFTKLDK